MEQLKINTPSVQMDKKYWAGIFIFWIITQLVCLYFSGINDKQEAETYLSITNNIVHGDWSMRPSYYLYSGYIFFHLIIHFVGLSYKWMYLVQLFLSAFALIAFTKLLQAWLSSKKAVFITAILYATCPFIQLWVSFLYTDSVFTSLLTIALYWLVFQSSKKATVGLWIAIVLLPFFRPVGFLFIILAIFYWLTNQPQKKIFSMSAAIIYLIAVIAFIKYAFTSSPAFFYPYHNAEANIVCGLPSGLMHYIKVPYQQGMTMFHFFTANPTMTFFLFSHRLFKSFWITRPYFSSIHNLIIIILLLPYYFFTITGFLKITFEKTKNFYFLIIGVMLFTAPLVLFCVDWLTRFTLPIFPFIFLIAGFGVDFWNRKIMISKTVQ